VGQSWRKSGLTFAMAATLTTLGLAAALNLASLTGATARTTEPTEITQTVSLATLPAQAQQTERQIRTGGPFAYGKDGVVFGNRERLLPRHPRGYYREYTVPTPGSKDRGARRIVCGGSQPREPEACFYTDDHYTSFRRIVP
jgi:ribonuclease T1